MDAPGSPLILTKVRVPAARPRSVARTRLVARLALDTGTGLLLVCAPAGYGKTTLLAEWARSLGKDGRAVAWYGLDADDDNPASFSAYLLASLSQALGPLSELAAAAQRVRSSPELDVQGLLPAVINAVAASRRECVLILDDYHLIGAPAIHSAVAFLIEHLPENMHVVIGSRADPPLPLARLRGRGQLLEIRAADLRFLADETQLFLNDVMQLDLAPELVAVLAQRTEGWIAGLQLAALSLAGREDKESFIASFGGSQRYLAEYLLAEVVGRQPQEVRTFLLWTSILDRLCGPLCDAMLAGEAPAVGRRPGSEAVLAQLEQANLFLIGLDEQGEWYRYHHLFRDFLRSRLEKTQPERVCALHRAAAEWYSAHGYLREAVHHALQTGDWDYAAAMVEQHCFSMLMHSELATIYEWCASFPEEVMRTRPLLCIHQSWTLVFSARRQNRARVEGRLRQAEQAIAALAATDRQAALLLADHAATVRSYLAVMPDPALDAHAQLALARQQLAQYPEDDVAGFSMLLKAGYAHMALQEAEAAEEALAAARRLALGARLYYGVLETTFQLARLAHSQGRLERAAELCRAGRADISEMLRAAGSVEQASSQLEEAVPAVGCLDIALGCVHVEQDRPAEAERELLHGLELVRYGINPYPLATACVALFRLREMQGRSAEALGFLGRLEETWPDSAFCTQGLRAVHALRTSPGDPATLHQASAWSQAFASSLGMSLRDDMPAFGMGIMGGAEIYYLASLAWVRCQIATGNARGTGSYLERQLALAAAHGLTDRLIELSLLQAQAAQAEGNEARARAALERALGAAQPAGYVRSFDQGPDLSQLLVESAWPGIYSEYARRLSEMVGGRDASGRGSANGTPLSGSVEPAALAVCEQLSERELEVLRLMARGASNQEIAEQLVVTVGTVKSHINHILGKLAAHNRTQAVARAHTSGLLAS